MADGEGVNMGFGMVKQPRGSPGRPLWDQGPRKEPAPAAPKTAVPVEDSVACVVLKPHLANGRWQVAGDEYRIGESRASQLAKTGHVKFSGAPTGSHWAPQSTPDVLAAEASAEHEDGPMIEVEALEAGLNIAGIWWPNEVGERKQFRCRDVAKMLMTRYVKVISPLTERDRRLIEACKGLDFRKPY
jgi:hypothetical protein